MSEEQDSLRLTAQFYRVYEGNFMEWYLISVFPFTFLFAAYLRVSKG